MSLLLTALSVALVLVTGWLFLLTLLSREPPRPRGPVPPLFFDVLVPACDEEERIVDTLRSLRALDWPAAQLRILVVADNCTDRTAEVAAAQGAWVLRREDRTRRGKGFALALAFEKSLADGHADAVVVIDADSSVSPRLLQVFAARLGAGARAIQGHIGVRNPNDSWRTGLLAIALAAFDAVRSRGRERLGLSCGLRGDGMCLSREALRAVPYRTSSLVEDVEYGLSLAEAGLRVEYADEARVDSDVPATAAEAEVERRRWESGRRALVPAAPRLLWLSLRRRDVRLFELAIDLLIPPLSTVAAAALLCLACSLALGFSFAAAGAALSLCMIAAHAWRGWELSGTGRRGLAALAHLPWYLLWKLRLALTSQRAAWTRPPHHPRHA